MKSYSAESDLNNDRPFPSVCIVVAYFGDFPHYFPLWVKSCAASPTVDFLILTDSSSVPELPKNVRVEPMTLDMVRERATVALGFPASLEYPYKMCDYKPAYGLLFSDFLQGYDYWGHCDIDLIFGDLRAFFDLNKLDMYDKFNGLGHLGLYRNTTENNNRFKLSGGSASYKEVYSNSRGYAFDEQGGLGAIYRKNGFSYFNDYIFADISSIYSRFRIATVVPFDNEKPQNYKYQIFSYQKGKCYREYESKGRIVKEEFQYIHFKKRPNFSVDFDINTVDSFYITSNGFIPIEEDTSIFTIRKYNPYSFIDDFKDYVRYKGKCLGKRVGAVLKRI